MPRASRTTPKQNTPEQLTSTIQKAARESVSKDIQDTIRRLPTPQRLAMCLPGHVVDLGVPRKLEAAYVQIHGLTLNQPCNECQKGIGPFDLCVSAAIGITTDIMGGACANCYFSKGYSESRCSLRDSTQIPNGRGRLTAPRNHLAKRKDTKVPPHFIRNTTAQWNANGPSRGPAVDYKDQSEQGVVSALNENRSLDRETVNDSRNGRTILKLVLPDLDPNDIATIEELAQEEEELMKLRHRDMSENMKSVADFDSAFESFKLSEKRYGTQFLVRPSGRLDYPIAHYLNQPSFSTRPERWEDGPTADMFNPCTRMVMENAFKQDHTIMFDHIHHRSHTCEDINQQNSDLYIRHVSFTRDILDSIESKVVLVYGAKLQRSLIQSRQLKFLPLWGRYEGTLIALDREENYTHCHDHYRYRRIFCFSLHPQRLMYEPRGSDVLVRHDRITEAAATMAGLGHLVHPNFYRDRRWTKEGVDTAMLRQARNLASQYNTSQLALGDIANREPALEVSALSLWNEMWDDQPPHSNRLLATEVIPTALAIWDEEHGQAEIWNDISEIPPAVFRWLQGSRHAIFGSSPVPVQDEDIVKVLSTLAYPESTKAPPLNQILWKLISNQHELVKLVAQKRLAGSLHCGVGQTLPIECYTCCNVTQDGNPQWAVNWPGHFYVPKRTCRAPECYYSKHNERWFQPETWDVLRTPANAKLHEAGYDTQYALRSILRTREECARLPNPVESWCIRCKEETRTETNERTVMDRDPSWTLGTRPLYVEKRPGCLSCKDAGQPTGRFVPTDADIPSVLRSSVIKIAQYLVDLDREVRGVVLDSVLKPSAREYRKLSKKIRT